MTPFQKVRYRPFVVSPEIKGSVISEARSRRLGKPRSHSGRYYHPPDGVRQLLGGWGLTVHVGDSVQASLNSVESLVSSVNMLLCIINNYCMDPGFLSLPCKC